MAQSSLAVVILLIGLEIFTFNKTPDAPPYDSKSEPTTLEQHETYSGTSYSIVELTLYKVHGGNTTTAQIDADDI